jgi:hypothetical protein
MNVIVLSAFRNAASYVGRYFAQVRALGEVLPHQLLLAEGDHMDNTRRRLWEQMWQLPTTNTLLQIDHGGPDHGSVVNSVRFANLATVWNTLWGRIPEDADYVVFVEADLVWEPATIVALVEAAKQYHFVAPNVWLRRPGYALNSWYDTWGFRRNGRNFRQIVRLSKHLTPEAIDSVGSCFVIAGWLARQLCWQNEDVVVGLCEQARSRGYPPYWVPSESVYHL